MSNHYFIGIKIPLHIARSLVEQRESWGTVSHRKIPDAEDLHITLVFIGADPLDEIDAAIEALEKIEHRTFELAVTGSDFFGKVERPRVVFAAVEENESLNELQVKVRNAIQDFGMKPDTKPFVPHITLANKWAGEEIWTEIPPIKPEQFRINEFSLFRIDPGGKPRYVALKTYKLKDGE